MKRTLQRKNLKRLRNLGFRARRSTKAGKRVLKRRREKGRYKLTVSETYNVKRKRPKHKQR